MVVEHDAEVDRRHDGAAQVAGHALEQRLVDERAVGSVDAAEVSVGDTGVGIAQEESEAVFEEFPAGGNGGQEGGRGTGLGLTLCRKFVELHSGKILG